MSCLLLSMLAWLICFSETSESKSFFCKNSSYFVGERKAEKASLPYQFYNPQNEMFVGNKTKRNFLQNEMFFF